MRYCFCIVYCIICCAYPVAAQAVVLDDDFSSGNPGWTGSGGFVTLSVESDAGGIGTGDALKTTTTAGNRQIQRSLDQAVVMPTHSSITLTADYRFTGAPNDANNSFLFFFNNTSIGSQVGPLFNPGHVATSNDSVFRRNPADNNEGKFDGFDHGTTAQEITLTLTRSAFDELTFDLSWAGNPAGPYSSSSGASVTSDYFTYDQIEVGFLNSESGEFYLDNVQVSFSSTIWDGGGADDDWSTAANWYGDAAPPTGDDTTTLVFTGSTRTSPSVDTDYTVNGILFDTDADSFNIGGGSTIIFDGTDPTIEQMDDSNQEISAAIQLAATTTVDVSGAGDLTLSNTISESAASGLTKTGTGQLILSTANTYSGDTTISEGTLEIRHEDGLGEATADTTDSLTTVASGATLALNAAGNLDLYENMDIAGSGDGGAGAVHVIDGSWLLRGDLNISADATVEFDHSGGTVNRFSVNGIVTGSGDITFRGASVAWHSWVNFQTAGNTYTGVTTIDNSRLQINHDDGLGSDVGGTVVKGGGILFLVNGATVASEELTLGDSVGSTSGTLRSQSNGEWAGNVIIDYDSTIAMGNSDPNQEFIISGDIDIQNSSTLTLTNESTVDTRTLVISGDISESAGTGTVVKDGAQTVQMSGTNSYTGDTTISAGTLEVSGKLYDGVAGANIEIDSGATLSLGNADVFDTATSAPDLILNGGTLQLDSFDSDTNGELQMNNLTLTADSIIDFGSGNAELRFLGTITDLETYTLSIHNWSSTQAGGGIDQLFIDANLTNTELENILFYNDAGGNFLGSGNHLATNEVLPVPEASTWVSLGLFFAFITIHGIICYRRKQESFC